MKVVFHKQRLTGRSIRPKTAMGFSSGELGRLVKGLADRTGFVRNKSDGHVGFASLRRQQLEARESGIMVVSAEGKDVDGFAVERLDDPVPSGQASGPEAQEVVSKVFRFVRAHRACFQ